MHLPLVLIIENNQWAFGTPTSLQYAVPTLALRSLGYGCHVEGRCIDGTNVLTVFQTVADAVAQAREHGTITVIEAITMRLEGHSLADPFMTYVPAAQLEYWKTKDPLLRCHDALIDGATATEEQLRALDARIGDEVRAAAIEAEAGDVPAPSDIEAEIFVPTTFAPVFLDTPTNDGQHLAYHAAITAALREEMDRDASVFIIGEDVGISNGAFKITEGFSKRYDHIDWNDYWATREPIPQRRVIDAPLAEAGFCGLALGAALNGLRPVVEFQYADFASEAFKMIVNYAATQTVRKMGPVPIVFRMPSGWAPNTSIYHSVNPESWFASTPGLKIVAPMSAFDAKGLLKAAIRDDNPVLFLEYKAHYRVPPSKLPRELDTPVPDQDYIVPIGRARIAREGTDASVVTYGSQMFRALEAARRIQDERGASIEVVDLRTIVPFDREMIRASVQKTARALVTCEAPRTGAFGNSIVTAIVADCFDCLDAPVILVAAADTPVPFAPALEAAHLPTVDKLVAALHRLLEY
jgi:2-oxoisovalerate dehydrogenase E1 component